MNIARRLRMRFKVPNEKFIHLPNKNNFKQILFVKQVSSNALQNRNYIKPSDLFRSLWNYINYKFFRHC